MCNLCFKFKVWALKMTNKWNTDTNASLQSQNIYSRGHKHTIIQVYCVIYALNLKFELLKWQTNETLTNTLAYNHKILNYNPKTYYYARVVCNLCLKFEVWAFKMMNKWNTDIHASLQSQNISLQPQNILLYRCSV